MLWQLLVAGFVGCLYYFRRFVGRLRSGKGDTKE